MKKTNRVYPSSYIKCASSLGVQLSLDELDLLTPEFLRSCGGCVDIGGYTIEIASLYNRKTKDYSGGLGKLTLVVNDDFSVDRQFRNPENAIAFVKRQLRHYK